MLEAFKNFFKDSPKEELTVCVCVVTSYAVTAAVVRVYKREGAVTTPVVLFSYEEHISLRQAADSDMLAASVAEHARKCLEKCRSFSGVFDKVVYTLGEPWVITTPRALHVEKTKSFKVTRGMINDLVSRDTKLFESEMTQTNLSEDIGIIEVSKPVISLNGYQVKKIMGTPVKTLDVYFTVTHVPARLVEELILAFADVFHHTNVSFASLNTAQATLVDTGKKATFLMLGGVGATISVVDHGMVGNTATLSKGLFDFETHMMHQFDIHQKQMAMVMRFADDEKFLQHHRDQYYKRIRASAHDLSESLYKSLLQLKRKIQTVPTPIYVLGNPSWVDILTPFLEIGGEHKLVALDQAILDTHIVYAHEVKIRHIPLSLAVMQAVENIK